MNNNDSVNGSTLANESQKYDDMSSKNLKTTAYAVVFVLSVVGNFTVLTIIKKNLNGSRKVVTNIVIGHMALADIISTIFGLPIMIWRTWRGDEWIARGIIGKALCKVDVFIIETSFAVSGLTIALIALERYLVIFYPTRKILTCSRAFGAGLLAWLFSAIFYCPKLYDMTVVKRKRIHVCTAHDRLIKPWRFIETLLYITLLVFTFALYLAIIIKVCYYNSSTYSTAPQTRPRKLARRKMNRRVLCQSLVIIFVYYTCWAPYLIVYLSCFFSKNTVKLCHSRILIHFLVFFFAYSNAAANPFVYATLSENFRSGFRLLIYRLLCCGEDDEKTRIVVRNQINLRAEHQDQPQLDNRRNGFFEKSTTSAACNRPCDTHRRETKFELIETKKLNPRNL